MRDSDWEILDELGRNRNVSRAAGALYMSQPALTKRLQHMEAELGVHIADRTARGLSFTQEGEYLCRRAGEHLAFVEQTRKRLEAIKRAQRHVITVGSSYTFNKYNLWDVLGGFGSVDPEVRFDVVNAQSDELFRRLLTGELDVAFVRNDYDGLVDRVLVDRSQAYLVTAEPVTFDDLPKMQRLAYRTNPLTTALLDAWWQARFGASLPEGMAVGYIDFVWEPIAAGAGYALCFLPEGFDNPRDFHLVPLIMPDGTPVVRNSWCLWQKVKSMPAHLREFVEFVAREVAVDPGVVLLPSERGE